jgi:hypothetical protein
MRGPATPRTLLLSAVGVKPLFPKKGANCSRPATGLYLDHLRMSLASEKLQRFTFGSACRALGPRVSLALNLSRNVLQADAA